MSSTELEIRDPERTTTVLEVAQGLVVKDDGKKSLAIIAVDGWKGLLAEVDETFDPGIKKAHELHKELLSKKAKHADPLKAAIKLGNQKILGYDDEVRRQAEAAERKRQAEEDRQREAEEKALEEAAVARNSGDTVKAEEILAKADEAAVAPRPTYVAPMPTSTPGAQTRWSAEVTDLKALCAAVASGAVMPEAVEPVMSFLNKIAVSRKTEDLGIPGVRGIKNRIR
jgi:hypothetical protein